MRNRWLSPRAFLLHFLLVTVAPGCLVAGWWQVHRALGGNFLSYFYSFEWPLFAVLAGVAWWQLIHDVPVGGEAELAGERRTFLYHGEVDEGPALRWDPSLETPELRAYNQYLKALSQGGSRKTWFNPRGLPEAGDVAAGELEAAEAPPALGARADRTGLAAAEPGSGSTTVRR